MSESERHSLLDDVSGCVRLHQGGEADIYLLCLGHGERLTLKWFQGPFNEALVENVSKIRDCGIYRIREFGIRENHPYQLYDFIEGVSSDSISVMPVAIALKALRQLVATLGKARTAGVSHGDLNPANVIFSRKASDSAQDFQTVLIDWGIVGPGALAFAAPERFQGKPADEKSDIFSLGMLLYRWLVGENLVQAQNFDDFAAGNSKLDLTVVSEKLFLSGRLSPEEISSLEPVWRKTLQEIPEERAEDLEELDELLEIALEKIGGGEVALASAVKKWLGLLDPQIQKLGQKFSLAQENLQYSSLPFKNSSPKIHKNRLKYAVLGGVGILAAVIALLIVLGTETPDVDDTGELILRKSRDLNMDLMEESSPSEDLVPDSLSVNRLLNDLPIPSKE